MPFTLSQPKPDPYIAILQQHTCTHTHQQTHKPIGIQLHVQCIIHLDCVHVWMCLCVYKNKELYTHTNTSTHAHTNTHTCTPTHRLGCVHTHTHTHAYIMQMPDNMWNTTVGQKTVGLYRDNSIWTQLYYMIPTPSRLWWLSQLLECDRVKCNIESLSLRSVHIVNGQCIHSRH